MNVCSQAEPYAVNDFFSVFYEVLAAGREPCGLRIFAETPEGLRPAANKLFTA